MLLLCELQFYYSFEQSTRLQNALVEQLDKHCVKLLKAFIN